MTLAPLVAFRMALSDLESHLMHGRWIEAGTTGQALADAVEACRQAGIVLSPEALQDAKTLFARCVTLTADWGRRLHQDLQHAGNTSRAMQNYRG
ncbi:MAG: hypothetical protein SF187_18505 [Deltaproteobacteria bacterium]|nr:hypothetical protein [Deltaproteobacteria bacterium]